MPDDALLGKWPRLLVAGDSVTSEQADEILVRTNQWHLMSRNDITWLGRVWATASMKVRSSMMGSRTGYPDVGLVDEFVRSVGGLELEYLNNERIISSWIGGPRGWCDWAGNIGASTYGIGKWPTVEAVTREWAVIATAFPYLRLSAQLTPEPPDEDGDTIVTGLAPVVEWEVLEGRVHLNPSPRELIVPIHQLDEWDVLSRLMPGGERGSEDLSRLALACHRLRDVHDDTSSGRER